MKKINPIQHNIIKTIIAAFSIAAATNSQSQTQDVNQLFEQQWGKGRHTSNEHNSSETSTYFTADVGMSLMEDVTAKGIAAPPKVSFAPGVRFSLGAGCNFYSSQRITLGGEFETGLIFNSFDSATRFGVTVPVEGDYLQVPLLANLVVNINSTSGWTPYAGIGGGGVYSRATLDSVGGIPVSTSADETDGAMQAMGGLRYRFSEESTIGFGYKYLLVFADGTENIGTHSISLIYSHNF